MGRLAILDGDVRSAYGPNLSLALEVLKHGDRQSRQAVVQFLAWVRLRLEIAEEIRPIDTIYGTLVTVL